MSVGIKALGPGDLDSLLAAGDLFDHPIHHDCAQRFLDSEGHHVLVAFADEEPAGFVSGVEMTHPDKGTEMFLYELAVAKAHRGQGIGRTLVEELGRLASNRGCYGMWVATEPDNDAALRTYRSAGSDDGEDHVILTWEFSPARSGA